MRRRVLNVCVFVKSGDIRTPDINQVEELEYDLESIDGLASQLVSTGRAAAKRSNHNMLLTYRGKNYLVHAHEERIESHYEVMS